MPSVLYVGLQDADKVAVFSIVKQVMRIAHIIAGDP
jgi:hypothetical protein